MFRPIKVHTPAGRIRIVGPPSAPKKGVPFEEFEDACDGAALARGQDDERTERAHELSKAGVSADGIEERLREEYQAGFEAGRRYAEQTLRTEYEHRLNESDGRIAALAADVGRQFEEFRTAAERDIVRLAIAIAERIVKREIRLEDTFVVRQIQEAMKRLIGVERIRIRINPSDEEIVRKHRNELLTSADAVRELTIEADETIPRGSCVLESDGGNVDASVQTQLERIEAALLNDQEAK